MATPSIWKHLPVNRSTAARITSSLKIHPVIARLLVTRGISHTMSVPTRKQTQDYERSFLGDYEGPCPICGHTLKNPTGGRCPECGSRLQIGLFAPFRFTPWHAMLASVGISIGIILDRVALTIVGIANSNGAGGAEQMFWFTLIPLHFSWSLLLCRLGAKESAEFNGTLEKGLLVRCFNRYSHSL